METSSQHPCCVRRSSAADYHQHCCVHCERHVPLDLECNMEAWQAATVGKVAALCGVSCKHPADWAPSKAEVCAVRCGV